MHTAHPTITSWSGKGWLAESAVVLLKYSDLDALHARKDLRMKAMVTRICMGRHTTK